MTISIISKAGKGKSCEWNFEDGEVIFSFKHQHVNCPRVGYKAFPKDTHWTVFTPYIEEIFNAQLAKFDVEPKAAMDDVFSPSAPLPSLVKQHILENVIYIREE